MAWWDELLNKKFSWILFSGILVYLFVTSVFLFRVTALTTLENDYTNSGCQIIG